MQQQIDQTCPEHPDPYTCPDTLIRYFPTTRTYGLIIHDGGSSTLQIHYCPWCGSSLSDVQNPHPL